MTGTEQVASASPDQCPECGGPIMERDREAVCEECGLVVGEHSIDHGRDWREFPSDPGPNRTQRRAKGVTVLRHDSGLGSEDPEGLTEMGVLENRVTGRDHDTLEIYVRREVYRIGAALDWRTSHKERAADLVKTLFAECGLKGKDADTIACAICWLVSRIFGLGLSPESVSEFGRDVDRDRMLRRASWVKRELELPIPLADYETRVRRVGSSLDVDQATAEDAVGLVRELDGEDKSGKNPSALAAAALYRVSDHTQARIAEEADVCTVSIRSKLPLVGSGGDSDD